MADHTIQAAPGQQIIDIVLPTYRMEPEEDERYGGIRSMDSCYASFEGYKWT